MARIIDCHVHDHFEIACMRRSNVILTLHDGTIVTGLALDLLVKDKKEFISLDPCEGSEMRHINLTDIYTLRVSGTHTLIKVS